MMYMRMSISAQSWLVDDGGQLVFLIREHPLEFQGFYLSLGSVVLGLDFGLSSFALAVEFVEHIGVGHSLLHRLIVVGPGLNALDFLKLGLGGF
jgi:hypothetical protein